MRFVFCLLFISLVAGQREDWEPLFDPIPRNVTLDEPDPGFKVRVTQNGLDYVRTFATDMLMVQLAQLTIPDVEERIGLMDVDITNIRITRFAPPVSEFEPIPDHGLMWNTTQIDPTIDAEYTATMNAGFFKIRKTGTVRISGRGMSFHLEFMIGRDIDGKPTISVSNCEADGDLTLYFSGGWSEGLNIGSRILRSKMRDIFLNELCVNAVMEIEQQAAWGISRFQVTERIKDEFELDFRLVGQPQFYEDAVVTTHLGAMFQMNAGERVLPPFQPPPIPDFHSHSDRMAYVYITDYLINSGFYAAFIAGKLEYNVTREVVPESSRQYLSTSCPGLSLCLGTFIPQISRTYPNGEVLLAIYATSAPTIAFRDGKMVAEVNGNADVYVEDDGETHHVITIFLTLTAHFTVHLEGRHVSFSILDITPNANLGPSNVEGFGPGAEFFFDSMVLLATNRFLLPKLTTLAEAGFMLPELPEVTFMNADITIDPEIPGVLIVTTDVEFPLPEIPAYLNFTTDQLIDSLLGEESEEEEVVSGEEEQQQASSSEEEQEEEEHEQENAGSEEEQPEVDTDEDDGRSQQEIHGRNESQCLVGKFDDEEF